MPISLFLIPHVTAMHFGHCLPAAPPPPPDADSFLGFVLSMKRIVSMSVVIGTDDMK
jgi:hypothetical protein